MMRDAQKELDRLTALGHNYGPAKQRYKTDLGEDTCVVFDPAGNAVTILARDVEHYAEKGFGTSAVIGGDAA